MAWGYRVEFIDTNGMKDAAKVDEAYKTMGDALQNALYVYRNYEIISLNTYQGAWLDRLHTVMETYGYREAKA